MFSLLVSTAAAATPPRSKGIYGAVITVRRGAAEITEQATLCGACGASSIAPLDLEVIERLVEPLHGDAAPVGEPDALAAAEVLHA